MRKTYSVIAPVQKKWDPASRRFLKNGVMNNIGLVLIDEVDLLNYKDHGPVLEAVVCWMTGLFLALKKKSGLLKK